MLPKDSSYKNFSGASVDVTYHSLGLTEKSIYILVLLFPASTSHDMNFFFCVLGSFYPLCVRSPLDTLESGVLFHIWWLSIHLLVLHDKSTMESSVVSSLPDVYLHPHARKHGVERSTMKHSSNLRSPFMWVILLIIHHQLSYLRENWNRTWTAKPLGSNVLATPGWAGGCQISWDSWSSFFKWVLPRMLP